MSTQCGTYAGYQKHRKTGQVPCRPCRDANAAYMRKLRANSERTYRNTREDNAARQRAHTRLARLYPTLFDALYTEELQAIRATRVDGDPRPGGRRTRRLEATA